MRHRRAHERDPSLARQVDIVGVLSLPRQQRIVFAAQSFVRATVAVYFICHGLLCASALCPGVSHRRSDSGLQGSISWRIHRGESVMQSMKVTGHKSVNVLTALIAALAMGAAAVAQAQSGPIRIGFLVPLTGPLATPGRDMLDGFNLYWEQAKHTAGGRKVEIVVADTTCNPDQAITQARRLVHQEKVHFMVG
ncbi:MAG: hypothetical protein EXR32_06380, partial [Betaproteobacteria bacterium]|nr:hypothetical protein [Betaproteobacteria bacterium]